MSKQEICRLYRAMVERAAAILNNAPYYQGIDVNYIVEVSIDGDKCVVRHATLEQGGYDDFASMTWESVEIPLAIMEMSEVEYLDYVRKEENIINAKNKATETEWRAKERQQRLLQYLALKAEFERDA